MSRKVPTATKLLVLGRLTEAAAPHLSFGQLAFLVDQASDLVDDWPGAGREVLTLVVDPPLARDLVEQLRAREGAKARPD